MDATRAFDLLNDAGYDSAHSVQPPGPAPVEFALGQRPKD